MLLTVKKQIEETVEIKTPAYYKGLVGYFYINDIGELTTVTDCMISLWGPSEGRYYTEEIERLLRNGSPCSKEDFDKAYEQTLNKIQAAVGKPEAVNS